MSLQYIICHFELSYPLKFPFTVIFPYPVNAQENLRDLLIGLNYSIIFPYPVKY